MPLGSGDMSSLRSVLFTDSVASEAPKTPTCPASREDGAPERRHITEAHPSSLSIFKVRFRPYPYRSIQSTVRLFFTAESFFGRSVPLFPDPGTAPRPFRMRDTVGEVMRPAMKSLPCAAPHARRVLPGAAGQPRCFLRSLSFHGPQRAVSTGNPLVRQRETSRADLADRHRLQILIQGSPLRTVRRLRAVRQNAMRSRCFFNSPPFSRCGNLGCTTDANTGGGHLQRFCYCRRFPAPATRGQPRIARGLVRTFVYCVHSHCD